MSDMDLSPIPIFRAGRHTAMSGVTVEFTDADLAAAAAAYDPAVHEAPIVVGHPQHDHPAYGWVAGLSYAAGGEMQAHPAQVEQSFAEMVKAGRFKKVSASWYTPDAPSNPKPGAYYLRHVGFLGAQPPAIKGLTQTAFSEDEEGVVELEFAEDADQALFARFIGWLTGQDPARRQEFAEALSAAAWSGDAAKYPDAAAYCEACLVDTNAKGQAKVKAKCHLPVHEPNGKLNRQALFAAQGALVGARGGVDLPADVKRAAARKLVTLMRDNKLSPAASLVQLAEKTLSHSEENAVDDETIKQREAELAEREKQIKAQEESFAEREQQIADRQNKERQKATADFVEGLVKDGKVLPRDQAGLVAFMAGLEAKAVVEFGEGEDAVKKPAAEWLQNFLEQLPPAIDYRERAEHEDHGEGRQTVELPNGFSADPKRVAHHQRALAYAEKHDVDYVTAAQAVENHA